MASKKPTGPGSGDSHDGDQSGRKNDGDNFADDLLNTGEGANSGQKLDSEGKDVSDLTRGFGAEARSATDPTEAPEPKSLRTPDSDAGGLGARAGQNQRDNSENHGVNVHTEITINLGENGDSKVSRETSESGSEKSKESLEAEREKGLKKARSFVRSQIDSEDMLTYVRKERTAGENEDRILQEIIVILKNEGADEDIALLPESEVEKAAQAVLASVDKADRLLFKDKEFISDSVDSILEDVRTQLEDSVARSFTVSEISNFNGASVVSLLVTTVNSSIEVLEKSVGVLMTATEKNKIQRAVVSKLGVESEKFIEDLIEDESQIEIYVSKYKELILHGYSEDIADKYMRGFCFFKACSFGAILKEQDVSQIMKEVDKEYKSYRVEVLDNFKNNFCLQGQIDGMRGLGGSRSLSDIDDELILISKLEFLMHDEGKKVGVILAGTEVKSLVGAELNHANDRGKTAVSKFVKQEFQQIVGFLHQKRRAGSEDKVVKEDMLESISMHLMENNGVVIGTEDKMPKGYEKSGLAHRKVIERVLVKAMDEDTKATKKNDLAFIKKNIGGASLVKAIQIELKAKTNLAETRVLMEGWLDTNGYNYEGEVLTPIERRRILKLAFEEVSKVKTGGDEGFFGKTFRRFNRQWEEFMSYNKILENMEKHIELMDLDPKLDVNSDTFKGEVLADFKLKYPERAMSSEDFDAMLEIAYEEALAKYLKVKEKTGAGESKRGRPTKKMRQLLEAIKPLFQNGWTYDEIKTHLSEDFDEGMTPGEVDKMFKEAFERTEAAESKSASKKYKRAKRGSVSQRVRKGARYGWSKSGEAKDYVFGAKGTGKRKTWKYGLGALGAFGTYWAARLAVGGVGVALRGAGKIALESGKAVLRTPGKTWDTVKARTSSTAGFMWNAKTPKYKTARGGFLGKMATRVGNFGRGAKSWSWRIGGKVLAPIVLAGALTVGAGEGLARGLGGFGDIGGDTVPMHQVDGESQAAHGGLAVMPWVVRDIGRDGLAAAKRASDFSITRMLGIAPTVVGKDGKEVKKREKMKVEDLNHIKLALKDAKIGEVVAKVRKENPDAGLWAYSQMILGEMHSGDVASLALAGADLLNIESPLLMTGLTAVSMLAGDKPKKEEAKNVEYKEGLGRDLGSMNADDFKAVVKNFNFEKMEAVMGRAAMTEGELRALSSDAEKIRFVKDVKKFFGSTEPRFTHRAFRDKHLRLENNLKRFSEQLKKDKDPDENLIVNIGQMDSLFESLDILRDDEVLFNDLFGVK